MPKTLSPWDACRKLQLSRRDPGTGEACVLEPGVNFFVLMLEREKAQTMYSCEGHPGGFYILFRSNYRHALRVERCGFFTVELDRRENVFAARWNNTGSTSPPPERHRRQVMRWAAKAWEKEFGPLKFDESTS